MATLGLELAAASFLFWDMQGYVSEGRAWLAEALDRADSDDTEASALALFGAGWLAYQQGDERATDLLENAVGAAKKEWPRTRALALSFLGGALSDDPERARALSQEAVDIVRTIDDPSLLAGTINNLAELFREDGDHERAAALYDEACQVGLDVGDEFHLALYENNLGEMAYLSGDLRRARVLFSQALERSERRGDRRHLSIAELDLGWVSLAEGGSRSPRSTSEQASRPSRTWATLEPSCRRSGVWLGAPRHGTTTSGLLSWREQRRLSKIVSGFFPLLPTGAPTHRILRPLGAEWRSQGPGSGRRSPDGPRNGLRVRDAMTTSGAKEQLTGPLSP